MVATATPAYLHRLYWAVPDGAPQDDESLIGELPVEWNWLVDWYAPAKATDAKLVNQSVSVSVCGGDLHTVCRFISLMVGRGIPTIVRASTSITRSVCRTRANG